MPRVVVTAEVENLEKWEKSFRTHGDLFRQMGVSRMEFATGPRQPSCGVRRYRQPRCLHEDFQFTSDCGGDGV